MNLQQFKKEIKAIEPYATASDELVRDIISGIDEVIVWWIKELHDPMEYEIETRTIIKMLALLGMKKEALYYVDYWIEEEEEWK